MWNSLDKPDPLSSLSLPREDENTWLQLLVDCPDTSPKRYIVPKRTQHRQCTTDLRYGLRKSGWYLWQGLKIQTKNESGISSSSGRLL